MTKTKLFGLFLTGGQSQRMNQEKALLEYHGISQVEYYGQLLTKFCKEVFVSCRYEQEGFFHKIKFQKIYDHSEYSGIGPLGGILSAMKEYPEAAWLVLACDMPFVQAETISCLLKNRDSRKAATVFLNEENMIEPLCAVYESHAFEEMLLFFKDGIYSPKEILSRLKIVTVGYQSASELLNVNSQEEKRKALNILRRGNLN